MRITELTRPDKLMGIYGLRIDNLPNCGRQKLSPKWLEAHKHFITQDEKQIIIHTVEGDVVFHIDHACINKGPTRYCLTCNELLPDQRADPFAIQSRAHVAEHGESAEKSERWPPGYMVVNSFECTVEDRR